MTSFEAEHNSGASAETPFDPKTRYEGEDPVVLELWKEIHAVQDPEIGLSLVDLGLIYDVQFDAAVNKAHVTMTLTSMGCPATPYLQAEVAAACKKVPAVTEAQVEFVFSPPWNPREMATEEVQMLLGYF